MDSYKFVVTHNKFWVLTPPPPPIFFMHGYSIKILIGGLTLSNQKTFVTLNNQSRWKMAKSAMQSFSLDQTYIIMGGIRSKIPYIMRLGTLKFNPCIPHESLMGSFPKKEAIMKPHHVFIRVDHLAWRFFMLSRIEWCKSHLICFSLKENNPLKWLWSL